VADATAAVAADAADVRGTATWKATSAWGTNDRSGCATGVTAGRREAKHRAPGVPRGVGDKSMRTPRPAAPLLNKNKQLDSEVNSLWRRY